MKKDRIPSTVEIVEALAELGGHAGGEALCAALAARGHPLREAHLGIQRACGRGSLEIDGDRHVRLTTGAPVATGPQRFEFDGLFRIKDTLRDAVLVVERTQDGDRPALPDSIFAMAAHTRQIVDLLNGKAPMAHRG